MDNPYADLSAANDEESAGLVRANDENACDSSSNDENASPLVQLDATEHSVDARLPRADVRTIALNTWLYMATPMSMPATVAVAGARWSMVFFTYSAGSTYWTGHVLGKAFLADPTCTTYAKMTSKAASRVLIRRGVDESKVGKWEPRIEFAVLVLQFVTYYLDATVQIVYITQYFGQTFTNVKMCSATWALFVGVMSLPVVQIPTIHDSGRVVALPCVAVVVALAVFFGEILSTRPWEKCDPGPTYGRVVTSASVFNSLGNFAYGFGGHGLYPEELRELKNPEDWPKVLNITYGTMVPIYLLVMYWGYKAYGDFAKGNINLNFPHNGANIVSMLMQSVQCYYGVFFTSITLMMRIETYLGVDPTRGWSVVTRYGVSPAVFRLVFRTFFLATEVIVAAIFLAVSGDVILDIQSLAGAVGMTAMTFFLPSLIHYGFNMTERSSNLERFWVVVNFTMGVAIMFSGLYGSLSSLFANKLVDQCPVEYVYAPHDPRDPCYVSGIHY